MADVLLIDNYDSYVYSNAGWLCELTSFSPQLVRCLSDSLG